MCNELGRLSQGHNNVKGNNNLFFIPQSKVPKSKKIIYAQIACAIYLQKTEIYYVGLTTRGNIMNYKEDPSIPTCSIETIKIYQNSVLSTPRAKYCILNIKDFFLIA